MERSEPTLVPEWLKGGSGLGGPPHLSQPNFYQDDAGSSFSSKHRSLQQMPAAGSSHGDFDSPRSSSSSDRAIFPSSRRGSSGSSGVVERLSADKDSLSLARVHPGLGRSSSHRNLDTPERDRDGLRGERDRDSEGLRGDRDWDWDREIERSRDRDRVPTLGSIDERERERERNENGSTWRVMPGVSGRLEADPSLWRSQPVGPSTRSYDNGLRKTNESISLPAAVPSGSSGLAVNMQKAVFERNFPSLGADEKQGSSQQIMGNAAVVSPRPLWQGSPRPDFGRSSSPGGLGRNRPLSPVGSTTSVVNLGGPGAGDVWSSALAESPFGSHNVLNNGVVPSVSTVTLAASFNPGVASAISSNALNMAEALVQNPPRSRTPPQLLIESQRLEELALKQSRQLIPMTPSLPKTMSAADKAKPKVLRTVDTLVPSALKGGQPAGSSQLNSPHRSAVTARPETPKSSQGKLLVLKPSKDGGSSLSSSMKIEGSNPAQGAPLTGTGINVSATSLTGTNGSNVGVISVRKQKQFLDRRVSSISAVSGIAGIDGGTGVRARDSSIVLEDKRPSLQAQNRSDFFNTLRKKAAGNGALPLNPEKLDSSSEQKLDGVIPKMEISEDTTLSDRQNACADGNGSGKVLTKPSDKTKSVLSNGDLEGKHIPVNGIILEGPPSISVRSSAVDVKEENQTVASVMGTSEEEAAFLRSLGWEENAEGEALTEEEINAFYQMREKKLSNEKSYQWMNAGVEHQVGSLESISSALSSSDSESDD